MASNILSKFLPPTAEPSIYETLRQHEHGSDEVESVGPGSIMLDEGAPDDRFLDDELAVGRTEEHDKSIANASPTRQTSPNLLQLSKNATGRIGSHKSGEADDVDDEVPQSLLIEDQPPRTKIRPQPQAGHLPPPVPGPSTPALTAKWQTTRQNQQLHFGEGRSTVHKGRTNIRGKPLVPLDPKEQATWMWANVDNLDQFLNEVYDYYAGHGMWSILLGRVVKLL